MSYNDASVKETEQRVAVIGEAGEKKIHKGIGQQADGQHRQYDVENEVVERPAREAALGNPVSPDFRHRFHLQ